MTIKDLTVEASTVDVSTQIRKVERKQTKDGKPYLSFTLGDCTGDIEAKLWDIPDGFECEVGSFLKVRAEVTSYRDQLQLKIKKLRLLVAEEVVIEDFLPVSKRDRNEMMCELNRFVGSLQDDSLRFVMTNLCENFKEELRNAPAAKRAHQAYLGGLLEHILAIANLAHSVCVQYPELNRDVLITSAVVHDIGKLKELSFQTAIDQTREGALVGHIIQGSIIWYNFAKATLSPAIYDHVAHVIASHHGCREWGSPIIPATREARVFHLLDMIDSQLSIVNEALDKGAIGYHTLLGTSLWDGKD